MGKLNLLKGRYTGKVGETVGSKWKDKSTVRTFSAPTNPDTPQQQTVRTAFGEMTTFVALFADLIKYKSAMDTSGMSLRNAIIKENHSQIASGTFDKSTLLISKGGLQLPNVGTPTVAAGVITIPLTAPTATNLSANCKYIAVFVDDAHSIVEMKEVAKDATSIVSSALFTAAGTVSAYVYFLDKRGSSKIASKSVYKAITVSTNTNKFDK